jgi:GTPase SAR1 family protein
MVYLLHGQPGCGKTSLAKKLQIWLQTDKKKWRKSVFHIEEGQTENPFEVARYLNECGNDVVMSLICPKLEDREKYKHQFPMQDIYLHTTSSRLLKYNTIENYEPPVAFCMKIDTTRSTDETFAGLIKILI